MMEMEVLMEIKRKRSVVQDRKLTLMVAVPNVMILLLLVLTRIVALSPLVGIMKLSILMEHVRSVSTTELLDQIKEHVSSLNVPSSKRLESRVDVRHVLSTREVLTVNSSAKKDLVRTGKSSK